MRKKPQIKLRIKKNGMLAQKFRRSRENMIKITNRHEINQEDSTKSINEEIPVKIVSADNYFWKSIEAFKRILPVITLASLFFGTTSIYFYLKGIGGLPVFSEVIKNPQTLISISALYFIFNFMYFSFIFYTPCFLSLLINDLKKQNKLNEKLISLVCFLIINFLPVVSVFLFFMLFLTGDSPNFALIIFISIIIIISFIVARTISNNKSYMEIIMILAIPFMSLSIFPIFIAFSCYSLYIRGWLGEVSNLIIPAVCVSMLWLANNFYVFYQIKENKNNYKFTHIFVMVVCFILAPFTNLTYYTMTLSGYIERPGLSGWYLLDTRFLSQNGLAKVEWGEIQSSAHLSIIQKKFEKPLESNIKQMKYPNAVYGYFAWNLGNTKIFCPANISIPDETKKHTATDCLFIKGEYLQPIPNGLDFPNNLVQERLSKLKKINTNQISRRRSKKPKCQCKY